MYEFFWMLIGGAITGIAQHLYKNKKLMEVINEERAVAERKIKAVRDGLRK